MPQARPLIEGEAPSDIGLVAADMDGTLLDPDGSIPDAFWPLLPRLAERGVTFAVASGRQYPALAAMFGAAPELALIAENGAFVVRAGTEVSSSTMPRDFVEHIVGFVRKLSGTHDIGLVWSGRRSAYVERADEAFVAEAGRFYTSLEVVDDLLAMPEPPLKFAVYDFAGAMTGSRAALVDALTPFRVVMSSEHWMDVMDPAVDKGVALRALQQAVGVAPERTMVFGDYLNDAEMMAAAAHSFAMANAHPKILATARHRAPSNRDHGVIRVLTEFLDGRLGVDDAGVG